MSKGNAQDRRRVGGPVHKFNAKELADIRIEYVDDIFNVYFLGHFPKLIEGLSGRQIGQACRHIRYAIGKQEFRGDKLRSTALFGEVMDKPYDEIVRGFGDGVAALAFFLDFVTAFGIEIDGVPAPPELTASGVHARVAMACRVAKRAR